MAAKVFFSYAHEDEALLNKLKAHLIPLQREGLIDVWHDRDITAGTEWEREINEQLDAAQIILLLISSDFLRSDYSFCIEMKRAIERHQNGEARVIPIILRPVYWKVEPLRTLQALPTDAKPIKSWRNIDEAFKDVVDGLRRVIDEMQHPQQTSAPPGQTDPFENYLHSLDQDILSYLDETIFFMIPSQNHVIPLQAEATPDLVSTSKEVAVHALPMAFFAKAGIGETETVYNSFHQVYAKYEGRVLLLGDPGAGKTTTLMAFAHDAVSKRQVDISQPLPLLAPIATWDAEKQPSVAEWLASITPMLQAKDISRILEEGNALLLFDGLDELGSERAKKETKEQYDPRQRFIQLIPQTNRIVVTCRVRDYQEVGAKIALNGAVTLQSLTDIQIKEYLCDLPELWEILQVENELRDMARTPLLLGLFTFAFAGRKQEAQKLRSLSQGELRDTIFETYLKRRYDHKARKLHRKPPFTLEAIYEVLGRLAMEDAGGGGNQNVFKLHDFSRVFERDTAHQFVEFLRLLNVLIWQNENLRFIHLRMRDFFAFKYAQTVLFNGDPETRDRAAWALWQIPDERVVLLLIEALKDPYEYVRTGAVGALGRIGDVRAIEPLKELLTDNTPVISIYGKRVCDVAAVALKMIGTREAD